MLATTTLTLDRVSIAYNCVPAVESLSLSMEGGEIVGLLGPNGSGKSSTLNAIAGLYEPSAGSIRINRILRDDSPDEYARLVGLVPQEPSLYDELSARDNLYFFGQLYGLSGKKLRRRICEVLGQVRLLDRAECRLETLSGGMKRRVNLACALMHQPQVLLLDEPTTALDLASKECLFETLESLREEGRLIVFTTHELTDAEQLCDRVAVLRKGKLVAQGRVSEFQTTEEAILIGQLREPLAEKQELGIRNRLGSDVDFRVIGRRIRLKAPNGEQLGSALAMLYAQGVLLDSFRTPSAQLETYFLNEEGDSLDLHSHEGTCVVR